MGHLTLGELLGSLDQAISSRALWRHKEGSTTNGSNLSEKKPTRAPNIQFILDEDIVCSSQECEEVGIKSPTHDVNHVTIKQQRFQDMESAKGGFTSLMFNGLPILVDSNCPSGYLFLFNEDYLHFIVHPEENFRFEPFQKPINQNIKVGHIFLQCVFASNQNRAHGAFSALV